jgi:hypothetical protein
MRRFWTVSDSDVESKTQVVIMSQREKAVARQYVDDIDQNFIKLLI